MLLSVDAADIYASYASRSHMHMFTRRFASSEKLQLLHDLCMIGAGPPNLLKVLAAGPSSSNALFQFSLPKATDGVAAAGAGALDGLNLITRKDAFGRSASHATGNQVCRVCRILQ